MVATETEKGAFVMKPQATPTCRICASTLNNTVVDLGMSPLCESFVPAENLNDMEPYYPLHALVCDKCFLVQLQEYVAPEHIFNDYAYFSSYSTSWVEHARRYCHMIKDRLALGTQSRVVELASNDGYLLQHFLPLGIPVLGIEPAANVADVAIQKNIPTIVDFFGVKLATKLAAEGKHADLIAGNNVLAQVPDLNDFVGGMRVLLAPNGVITLEFPHLERLMAENQFDTIYHEHFSYFSLVTIEVLAAKHGLRIHDIDQLKSHGGSLRVYLVHEDSTHPTTQAVRDLLAHETALGMKSMTYYTDFSEQVQATKRNLLSFLIKAKNEGKRICGYGAPGKGNTLLNYCGIGPDFIDFTVDRNPYKHGRYTPGQHIPIRSIQAIDEAKPDYLLILPWNLKDEIVQQMRHVGEWGCKFVVPIPTTTIIDPATVLVHK